MGPSIGAFDESSNKMYGVSLNTNSSYSHADFPHFPKLDNISRFEDWSEPTIVKELGTKNILFTDLVVVCYDQLHLGIGKEFLIRCHQLARKRDFDTIVGMSITDNSARIASKYGWKCLKKIDLRSYRDSYTGEAVFAKATMPFVSVMYKDFRNINPKSKL
uniref:N-acetyltransferase domain-containing protein n=1 Tax=Ciona savignyi TaxID=51511 RepID=H2ZLY4_CIOSA